MRINTVEKKIMVKYGPLINPVGLKCVVTDGNCQSYEIEKLFFPEPHSQKCPNLRNDPYDTDQLDSDIHLDK